MPRISALPSASRAAGNDELPMVDTGASSTKKATVDLIMPTGSIMDFAGAAAPAGWLLCYGQTLDADTNPEYQALYDVIGNTYGGSDNSDFVVPDLRGRVVAGQDDMGGSSANRLTGTAGSIDGDTLGAAGGSQHHKHKGYNDGDGAGNGDMRATIGSAAGQAETINFQALTAVNPNTGAGMGNGTYTVAGTNQGSKAFSHFTKVVGYTSENASVQPTIILNKIIKY